MKIAIYPGTFDPITNGHLDILKRACRIFDKIYIAVALNASKKPMFSHDKRIAMAQAVTISLSNVEVIGFDKLLVDLCEDIEATIIIRGLRAVSDFEYELQMGYANASLNRSIETIYLMPSLEYAFVSSSVVRAILAYNGKIDHLVPPEARHMIKGYFR